ncbi:Zn-ribbon domain-containing OB-fold protein [Rhodococcoides kyotonense]|uniref:DUF35 OB-fold domain-containing protein, acyl-CoA-associated n=1 Tax=Rhodococcoides kyotonense TaxID=398843 RepID=A0A239M2F8_9NOCA|nr:OB-fold domain-containing protein [Rhodococcus kyotonensis]SNT36273.1 DUF35 OB-fold domain-containing protein, acyl-CoA-associated [Rhodococcus kyotonensis]
MEPHLVGPLGTLYSWTTVHVSTSRQVPYTIGYVDFPGDLRVLGEIGGEIDSLSMDATVTLRADADGTWSFSPIATGDFR